MLKRVSLKQNSTLTLFMEHTISKVPVYQRVVLLNRVPEHTWIPINRVVDIVVSETHFTQVSAIRGALIKPIIEVNR